MLVPLVGQHAEKHLLVNVLGPKRIHEHSRARSISLDERFALIELLYQLGCQHAPVNQVDPESAVAQLPLPQLQIPRVGNRGRVIATLEELFEQLELALSWQSLVIDDANLRSFPSATNALVDRKQGIQQVLSAIHRSDLVLSRELTHYRE